MLKRQAFIVGRFQPVHKGHLALIERALQISSTLIIFIGSSQESHTPRNPYSFEQRVSLILAAVDNSLHKRIIFMPLPDFPSNEAWVDYISQALHGLHQQATPTISVVTDKDEKTRESNFILREVKHSDQYVCNFNTIFNATDIRVKLFVDGVDPLKITELPPRVRDLIKEYMDKD